MTLDGLTLSAILKELAFLKGAKIEKVQQPQRDEVLLILHTEEGKKQLVLSASAGDCRVHLTEERRQNPPMAPNFCMFLRKYIGGGRIEAISQPGLERIAAIEILAKDEMGVPARYTLVAEIMGKHSNIMLLDENRRIMESLKHISFDVSRVRQVLPGMTYEFPPTDKADPARASLETLADVLRGKTPPRCICERIQGISPQVAEEILAESGLAAEPLGEDRARRLAAEVKEFITLAHMRPCIQKNQDGLPVFYSVAPFAAYAEEGRVYFDTMNQALDGYYTIRRELAALNARRAALSKLVGKHIGRVAKKLKIQLDTLAAAEKKEKYQVYGELITANLYQIKRGAKWAEVLNYYTNEPVRIPMDEALSPSQNAARYFKRFNKLKTAAVIAKKQAEDYQAELAFLEEEEYAISAAETTEELADIQAELARYGYAEAAQQKGKPRRTDPLSTFRRFVSQDGFTILAGRNSRSNDVLTMKVAGTEDIWFHGRNMPGSHVVLFTEGREPTDQALVEAATIAATLSKGKNAGKVDIDYTKRANVWKANGAKPGMVLYEGHKTLTVAPDAVLVKRLEKEMED